MARLPDGELGELLPLNIFRVMAHAPKLADGYNRLGGRILFRTELDPKARELVINAISLKLNCPYEWSHHGKWALDVGATLDELQAVKDGNYAKLGSLERACIEYALKFDDNAITDADIERLRSSGLDDKQIVELSFVAGMYGVTARFLNAMAVEIDEGNKGDFALPDAAGESRTRRTLEGT